jgi:ribonuclease T1
MTPFPRLPALLLSLCLLCASGLSSALSIPIDEGDGVTGEVQTAELPPEARQTLRRIERGGPFPYRRDGAVFNNYEHRLPKTIAGSGLYLSYREYTVKTPGARDRGARRIVCASNSEMQVCAAGDGSPTPRGCHPVKLSPLWMCYYTADHYRTFRQIYP